MAHGAGQVTDNQHILQLLNIKKAFPGVQALRGVDFELRRGEVHALVGENGAGKSTLMKIIMGVYTKDTGDILLEGRPAEIHTPEEAHAHGIGMIFQELSLVPQLDVAQNIYLGNEPMKTMRFLNNRRLYQDTRELMEKYNVHEHFDLKKKVMHLSRGYCQIVEVLKALSRDTRILIMDEPTASLTKEEEDTLYQIIMNLKARGVSIIYISHRLEEIFRNCDRVTVLRDGNKVATKDLDEVYMEQLIELMTGKKLEAMLHHGEVSSGAQEDSLLRVEGLSWRHRVRNVSFHVSYGEVVGITGLMGSGKSEIARAVFGISPGDNGRIFLDGREASIRCPWDAVAGGMALVPEDRRQQGLVLMHSVEENIALSMVRDLSRAGWFNRREARKRVGAQVSALEIKTPSIRQKTAFLSGGNQQKVVVGKWLIRDPKLLILDEPTVGIDVKTKSELRQGLRNMVRDKRCGVLLFSSELNEIIQVCDRIIVLYRGEIIKEFSNEVPIQEEILHRAIQGIILDAASPPTRDADAPIR
ncbi:MAG: sugar ABC transporter ATP-binding protein [Spirochaetales bacterium]|nr:sugar ABC transporter ATP-binding protein [Spirochaetales bacterium]